ncbi:MAG: hypothetical protein ACREUT_09380 [Steroidobacteraceae bacterium]
MSAGRDLDLAPQALRRIAVCPLQLPGSQPRLQRPAQEVPAVGVGVGVGGQRQQSLRRGAALCFPHVVKARQCDVHHVDLLARDDRLAKPAGALDMAACCAKTGYADSRATRTATAWDLESE